MDLLEYASTPLAATAGAFCVFVPFFAGASLLLRRRCGQPSAAEVEADCDRKIAQIQEDTRSDVVPADSPGAEPDAEPDSKAEAQPASRSKDRGGLRATWLLPSLCLLVLYASLSLRRTSPSAAEPEARLDLFQDVEVSTKVSADLNQDAGYSRQADAGEPTTTTPMGPEVTTSHAQQETSSPSSAVVEPSLAGTPDKRVTVQLHRQAVSLTNVGGVMYYKSAYYGNIVLTNKTFKVVFDTGSGHLILPTTYCHSNACRVHNRYSRKASKTAVDLDFDGSVVKQTDPRDQITVGFGTGDVTGVFIEELVCMEKSTLSAWTPEEQNVKYDISTKYMEESSNIGCMRLRFLAATKMSEDPFATFEFDGVLGLSLSGASQSKEFNFVDTLANHLPGWGNKNSRTFAVFLADSDHEVSEITFGGYDEKHMEAGIDGEGDIIWNEVLHPEVGHWMLKIKTLRVDDDLIEFCADDTCKAVVDTGTSLLGVPSASFPELYRNLWHPTALDGSCKSNAPILHVEFESGFTVKMGPEDYSHVQPYHENQIVANRQLPFPWGEPWSGGEEDRFGSTRFDLQCKPMMMSLDLAEPLGPKLIILGEPVLRKYYTIYDTERQRIGFGKARHVAHDSEQEMHEDEAEDWFWEDME